MINTKKLTKILIKYNLSPEEFYILDALYKKEFQSLKDYITSRKSFNKTILQQIEEKGYIEYFGKDGKYNIFDILITDKFYNNIYIDGETAGEEFFTVYPSFISIDGKKIMSKKCDRDLYVEKYCKDIGFNKDKHSKIIKGLLIAKKKGLINMAIRNFMDSKMYDVLIELEEQYGKSNNDQTFKKQL